MTPNLIQLADQQFEKSQKCWVACSYQEMIHKLLLEYKRSHVHIADRQKCCKCLASDQLNILLSYDNGICINWETEFFFTSPLPTHYLIHVGACFVLEYIHYICYWHRIFNMSKRLNNVTSMIVIKLLRDSEEQA